VPLFDRYLIVDWSAANVPVHGRDSIWLALFDGPRQAVLENIATRIEAMARIRGLILDALRDSKRLLAGFDFAFGYPAGAAARIAGKETWTALWARFSCLIEDGADNRSNSYAVAAQLNRDALRTPDGGPYWGHPHQHGGRYPGLGPRKSREALAVIGELRAVEHVAKGAKSVWQLAYNGAVGRQAILGMAHLERLRREPALSGHVAVWPFETRFAGDLSKPVVIAEVYPSLFPLEVGLHDVKDAAQVLTVARRFAKLDAADGLAASLDAPPTMTAETRTTVICEEGWIVGAGLAA
jgi:precorrin-8X/cobalt-precorrin-8 methylmutase